jgi:predicted DNA-binding protein with PD1-like motif
MKTRFEGDRAIVIFQRGERLAQDIRDLMAMPEIKGAATVATALGLVKNIDLSYGMYDGEKVWYEKKLLPGPLELLGISGFLLKSEEWPFHLHATFGDKNLATFGGHLFDAEVVTFIEMTLLLHERPMDRRTVDGLPELAFL